LIFSSLEEYRDNESGNVEYGDDYLKSVGIVVVGEHVQAASIVVSKNVKAEDKVSLDLLFKKTFQPSLMRNASLG
jgi:hypothetical protein